MTQILCSFVFAYFSLFALEATDQAKIMGVLTNSGEGWIEGRVTIGPLRPGPVHIDDPEPDASKLFSSHKIVILSAGQNKKIKEVSTTAKGNYKVSLPAGKYRVDFQPHDIGMMPYEPQTVIVQTGKTTTHNLEIDTGMR